MKSRPVRTYIKRLIKQQGGKGGEARRMVAEALDVDLSYVYKMEHGTAPGKHLRKIIKAELEKGNGRDR